MHVSGERCTSSRAVDESNGSRGRGGEERQGKGDHGHGDDDDNVLLTDHGENEALGENTCL